MLGISFVTLFVFKSELYCFLFITVKFQQRFYKLEYFLYVLFFFLG